MASISLRNIVKTYEDGHTVIDGLNLEIRDREFMILVGPSGCGKSTTLRMIAGLEEISGGDLYIGERRVNDVAPKDRDIAMVFQSYALYPHMSVYKNMAFALELRKVPREEIDRRVREAARMLDIEGYLDRKPRALSGGQRQRVALGRAMVRHPAVFLLDEPLSNLDAKLRGEMRSRIAKLHEELGTTFVYVTHDQTEAMTMADRIVVMRDGVIQQADTPENLYHFPVNRFVAGFIGTPEMNFLPVTVEKGGESIAFSCGTLPLPPSMREAARAYVGETLLFGIRPENFSLAKAGSGDFDMKAEISEMMGTEFYLHGHLGKTPVVARISSAEKLSSGITVSLKMNLRAGHLFDAETGVALAHGA